MRKTFVLARTAAIAAIYAAVTLVLAPLGFGPVQLRVAEALTVLPLFYAEAIPGLGIGCFIANMASGPLDMALGTAATLLAATATYFLRKVWLGVWPPIVLNALIVPLIFLTVPDITAPYWLSVLTVGAGQLLSVLALGVPLYYGVRPLTKKVAAFAPYRRRKDSEKADGTGKLL